MVSEQLRARGVSDERVLAAMARVPREQFISPHAARLAYGDHPLPLGQGQTISQPYIVASMAQAAEVGPEHRVLEVGTGTGYQAAILGELASEVWTIERYAELAETARAILARLHYGTVHVVHGDGSQGLPEQAPFDRIIVAAAAPKTPDSLLSQLAVGGRLVIPVGSRTEQQVQIVRRVDNGFVTSQHELCRFVPLVGAEGWQE